MKKKLYRTMCLMLIAVVVAVVAGVFAVYAIRIVSMGKDMVYERTMYLKSYTEAIDGTDARTEFLKKAAQDNDVSRITFIDPDGTVIFDSKAEAETMQNHISRKEVADAKLYGTGSDERQSETLGKSIYYCAARLNDGYILRVSEQQSSIAGMVFSVLAELCIIVALMCVASIIAASRTSKKIMEPINNLDINHIDNTPIYPEIRPFIERIKQDNARRDKIEQIRREFTANVSHELRTPLTAISGYAQMIHNGMAKPDDVRMFGAKIEKEADRLILLINDIINLSKLDETDEITEPEIINLKDIAKQVVSDLTAAAEKDDIMMYVYGSDAQIKANRTIIYEMIYNVTDNAIKYNKHGGRVSLVTYYKDGEASIMISDTGIGISEDDKERIFERFYRVDKSHSKKIGGTGLGLSIVKHAAMAHNAKIDLKSKPNEGTSMRITFPTTKGAQDYV